VRRRHDRRNHGREIITQFSILNESDYSQVEVVSLKMLPSDQRATRRQMISVAVLLLSLASCVTSFVPGTVPLYLAQTETKLTLLRPTRRRREWKRSSSPFLGLRANRRDARGGEDDEAVAQRLAEMTTNAVALEAKAVREMVLSLRNETLPGVPFDPMLLGNYNVSFTLPPADDENDRPVGGKWSRNPLLSIWRSYQHLVQPREGASGSVAQAVNVIIVRAWLWSIAVILRGDAYNLPADERVRIAQDRQTPGGGLSERTVRANFDPPRVVLDLTPPWCLKDQQQVRDARSEPNGSTDLPPHRRAWLSLSLGPRSSVVLDTPYCDSRIRIGKGSRGSLFVFSRLPPQGEGLIPTAFDDPDSWKEMLQIRPMGKVPLIAVFGGLALASLFASVRTFSHGLLVWNRVWSLPLGLASVAAAMVIALSTGGIENDSMSAREAKKSPTETRRPEQLEAKAGVGGVL
jgi:hypothetical protein